MIPIRTPKDPHERLVLTYDFANGLAAGETLSTISAVNVTVFKGVDATPSGVLAGSSTIVGTKVLIPVKDGLSGVTYDVEAIVDTSNSNKRLAITGRLVVAEGS